MLSKCANPECSAVFRYLHLGKIFHLSVPEAEASSGASISLRHERFWLCDQCSKKMTLVWAGTQVEVTPLPIPARSHEADVLEFSIRRGRTRRRAASAGRDEE